MKSVLKFLLVAGLFEIIALVVVGFYNISWLLDTLVALFILYLAFVAVRGWRRQIGIDMPDILQTKTVRRRHWRFF